MKQYVGEDLDNQTVALTEQTQFIQCSVDGLRVVDNGYGWELLGCFGAVADER